MLKVIPTTFEDKQTLSAWSELLRSQRLSTNTFSQETGWALNWWEHYGEKSPHASLLLLRVHKDEECIAIAPLVRYTRSVSGVALWSTIRFLGWPLTPYTDIICKEDHVRDAWSSLLQYIRKYFPNDWCEFDDIMPSHVLFAEEIPGWIRATSQGETYLHIDLLVDKSALNNVPYGLRKSFAAWESDGRYKWRFVEGYSKELSDSLVKLNRSAFKDESWFADGNNRRFFDKVSVSFGNSIWYSVIKHGAPVTVLMGFRKGSTLYHFTSGTTRDFPDANVRLGLLNNYFLLTYMNQNGFTSFDMLRGTEDYKRHFRPEETIAMNLHLVPTRANWRYHTASLLRTFKQKSGS